MAIIDPGHAAKQLVLERIFRSATMAAAMLVLVILGGVFISLVHGAWPALKHFGFSFVTREIWNPVTDQYGALAPIYGTVVTSLIAMLLAVPAGFGSQGLPIGLQIIGPNHRELACLQLALGYEIATGWTNKRLPPLLGQT